VVVREGKDAMWEGGRGGGESDKFTNNPTLRTDTVYMYTPLFDNILHLFISLRKEILYYFEYKISSKC
jgi:hypothetical protein